MSASGRKAIGALAGLSLLGSLGCLPPARTPLTVWAVDEGAGLSVDSLPLPETAIFSTSQRQIHLTAALNETVAFQLGLRATAKPGEPYTLEVSDLQGPAGMLPARANIALYRVHPVRIDRFRSWYPQHTGRPAVPTTFPDILVPWDAPRGGGPVTLDAGSNALIWVDIRVPLTASPGVYIGRLTIRDVAAAQPAFTCELRLRVFPVALPSARSLPVICRVDPRDLLAAHLGWPREPAAQTRLLPDSPPHQPAVELVNNTMRLFHEHRTTPVLWASFPKFRPASQRGVEIDWEPYDRLVVGWLNGDAFADQVRLSHWLIPASLEYPNAAAEGGLDSPRYARLLADYLSACRRHFEERGWLDRAFVRLCPPSELSARAVERVQSAGRILRQSETELPLVAHLPARSLRGLGWRDAPDIDLPDVRIWAPPAMWYEPQVMQEQRDLGRQSWMAPDYPPYSGTLAAEGLPSDAHILPWQALRCGAEALWIEHAADCGATADTGVRAGSPECLLYPGVQYGLPDQPVPSIRLKRLRRGLQDHALMQLLARRGKRRLADSLAKQVVRWACTESCRDHLLDGQPGGWPQDVQTLRLARELVLQELVGDIDPASVPDDSPVANLADWGVLMNQASRVHVAVDGVRLSGPAEQLLATAICHVSNLTNRALEGSWILPSSPAGWVTPAPLSVSVPPDTHRLSRLALPLTELAYNTDGVYPFTLNFDAEDMGAFATPARLAVAACPFTDKPPTVDADLSDWALASNNAAGDFRLVRGRRPPESGGPPDRPTLPTRAFFCMGRDDLYVAVRCQMPAGEPTQWRADNRVPLDGAVPWGQDVVEILIDPRAATEGTCSDIYNLQIKPNGVLVARRGCRTDPPMGRSEIWQSEATVAVRAEREAWLIELALPMAALGPDALKHRIWGFNVTRLDARRGEYSSWSGARGYCYSPKSLGNLILLRP